MKRRLSPTVRRMGRLMRVRYEQRASVIYLFFIDPCRSHVYTRVSLPCDGVPHIYAPRCQVHRHTDSLPTPCGLLTAGAMPCPTDRARVDCSHEFAAYVRSTPVSLVRVTAIAASGSRYPAKALVFCRKFDQMRSTVD